ncbi:MAG: hypothetical protein LC808_07005 [Actinobacteria bacterium]|nr:hypothetical protein [Actinomycetota bacterium]
MYPWVRRAKWFTVAATYVMNTWASYTAGSASAVVLHYTEAVTAVHERRRLRVRPDRQPTRQRKLLGEYLAEARATWSPGVVITPAWVRQVTACSRGLSSKVARALAAEQGGGGHERS